VVLAAAEDMTQHLFELNIDSYFQYKSTQIINAIVFQEKAA